MTGYFPVRNRIRCLSAKLRSDRGGAIVELAAVVSVMAAILFGAAEFAMLAYDSIEVSDAARAGASYAHQSVSAANSAATIRTVAAASANDISGLSTTPVIFYSCSSTPSTQNSTTPACGTGDTVLMYIQVNTTATITMPIHLPGLTSYTLNGQSIMRVQQ